MSVGGGGHSIGGGSHKSGTKGGNDEGAHTWADVYRESMEALFATAADLAVDQSSHWIVLYALWLFDTVQLVAFPLGPQDKLPWVHSSGMRAAFQGWLPLVFIPGAKVPELTLEYPSQNLFAFATAWTGFMFILLAWTAAGYVGLIRYMPRWRLKLLRGMMSVSLHGLTAPLLTSLLSPWSIVDGVWVQSGILAWSSEHITCLAIGTLLFVALLVLLLLVSWVCVDREFDTTASKRGRLASAHGRVFAGHMIGKAVLAITWVAGGATDSLSGWVYMAICAGAAGAHMWMYMQYMPYYLPALNEVQGAIGAIKLAAVASGLLGLALMESGSATNPDAAPLVFIILLPVAMYGGSAAVQLRWQRMGHAVGSRAAGSLASPFVVELEARYALVQAALANSSSGSLMGFQGTSAAATATSTAERRAAEAALGAAMAAGSGAGGGSGGGSSSGGGGSARTAGMSAAKAGMSAVPLGLVSLTRDSTVFVKIVPPRAISAAARGAGSVLGNNTSKKHVMVLDDLTRSSLDGLYRDAAAAFPSSALMNLFASSYLAIKDNWHLERMNLHAAEAKADASELDTKFFVWQRLRALNSEDGAAAINGAQRMTVSRRLEQERLMWQSRKQVAEARSLMIQFWSALAEKSPSLVRLSRVGDDINTTLASCGTTFRRMLEMAPQSTTVLRSYADYLLELANDPRRAMELLAAADQIEEEQSHVHSVVRSFQDPLLGSIVADFDINGENAAIIRVSARAESFGMVLSVNAVALKALGAQPRELIGRDINAIVPEPLDLVHPALMERYMQTGEEAIINTSRVYFVKHRAGFVFPAKVNVRPLGDEWAAVVEALPTDLSFLWTLGAEHNWRVTALCRNAMETLGVDVTTLRSGAVVLGNYLADPTVAMSRMYNNPDGVVILLRNLPAPGRAGFVTQHVFARLQMLSVAKLDAPVYIIRYRKATPTEVRAAATAAAAALASPVADGTRSPTGRAVVRAPAVPPHAVPAGGGDISLCPVGGSAARTAAAVAARTSGGSFNVSFAASPHAAVPPAVPASVPDATGTPTAAATAAAAMAAVVSAVGVTGGGTPTAGPGTPLSPPPISVPREAAGSGKEDDGSDDGGDAASDEVAADSEGESPPVDNPLRRDHTAPRHSGGGVRAQLPGSIASPIVAPPAPTAAHLLHSVASPHGSGGGVGGGGGGGGIAVGGQSSEGDIVNFVRGASGAAGAGERGERDAERMSVGGGKHDGAGSVHSKGSGTSAGSTSDLLRRAVVARSALLEPSLRNLRRAILFIFLGIALMNVALAVARKQLFQQLLDNLELVHLNGIRGQALEASFAAAMRLTLNAEGLGTLDDVGGVNETEAWMARNINSFEDLHRALYLRVDGSLAKEVHLYTIPSIVLDDLVPGTYVTRGNVNTTKRLTALGNLGLEYVAKARQFLAMPHADRRLTDPTVFWLNTNPRVPIRDACNASLLLADERSTTQADATELANTVSLAVALVALFLVAVGAVVPAAMAGVAARHAVFVVFLDVPVVVVRALAARVVEKVNALRRAEDEEDVGMDIGGEGDVEGRPDFNALGPAGGDKGRGGGVGGAGEVITDPLMAALQSVSRQAAHRRAVAGASANSGGGRRCCCGHGSGATTDEGATRRKFSNVQSQQGALMLRMVMPLLLFVGYYVGTYFWKAQAVQDVRYTRAEAQLSSQVLYLVPQEVYRIRLAYSTCDEAFAVPIIGRELDSASFSERVQDALLYGDSELGTRSTLQLLPSILQLYFGSTCVTNDGYYELTKCTREFEGGLLNTIGLRAAMSEYLMDLQLMAHTRITQLANSSSCVPTAFENVTHGMMTSVIGTTFLPPALLRASTTMYNEGTSTIRSFSSADDGVTAASVIALFVLYFGVYATLVRRLDENIKGVRALLLLLPDEVSRTIPSILRLSTDLLRDVRGNVANSNVAGSAASGGAAPAQSHSTAD